jgi:hypothetical protein
MAFKRPLRNSTIFCYAKNLIQSRLGVLSPCGRPKGRQKLLCNFWDSNSAHRKLRLNSICKACPDWFEGDSQQQPLPALDLKFFEIRK